jgi:hypothetical protein
MNPKPKTTWRTFAWLAGVLAAGLAARFWMITWGHNFDFDSYRVVVSCVEQGKNVYASTERYNYGPVWFNILHGLDLLSLHNRFVFRWLLVGLLSLADVGIFLILWRRFGRLAAVFFFLNPISIIITGFHNQFDNVALLFGLLAVLLIGDDFEKPVGRRKFSGLLLLGLSLATKHILFAFPLWLAVKQRGLIQKAIIVLIPVACFALGFLPYWSEGKAGIIHNVFHYQSSAIGYFYDFFIPPEMKYLVSSRQIWFLLLGFFAFVCRPKSSMESLLVYTAVLVAASPGFFNQYLAIPVAFVSVFVNPLSIAYTAMATLHLALDNNGPTFFGDWRGKSDNLAVYCLSFAVVWTLWRQSIMRGFQRCWQQIKRPFVRGN